MEWEHGSLSRRRMACLDGLKEGRLALEGGHATRREEFAAAAAHVELYVIAEAVAPWREFVAAPDGSDLDRARAGSEAFALATRNDDQKSS